MQSSLPHLSGGFPYTVASNLVQLYIGTFRDKIASNIGEGACKTPSKGAPSKPSIRGIPHIRLTHKIIVCGCVIKIGLFSCWRCYANYRTDRRVSSTKWYNARFIRASTSFALSGGCAHRPSRIPYSTGEILFWPAACSGSNLCKTRRCLSIHT